MDLLSKDMQSSSGGSTPENQFISGVVGTKFAWLSLSQKQVRNIDLLDLEKATEQ